MAEFPLDIVFDVLSRLPVKSVLRFRCVCKPWCSLISEPQFVKTQLNRAISDVNDVGCQRVLIPNHNGLKSIDYETQAQQNNGGNASTVLDFPWSGPDHRAEFVGSCHGMVCVVVDREKIVLCNPCTREFRELPKPTNISIKFKSCINGGLGYDSYVDDYKFVIAAYEHSDGKFWAGEFKAEVFSLRSNSWWILRDIPPDILRIEGFDMGVFSNGALHWIASCETGQQIISFDLATEKFKKMSPLPPCDQRTYHDYKHLILLRGCLSVSREFSKETTEVWVMKEYGVKASWTKLFTFTLREPGTRLCGYEQYLRPVCFSKNGELLVDVDGVEIRIYNPKEDKSRKLFNGFWWFNKVIVYLESLVSPNVGNAERNQPS